MSTSTTNGGEANQAEPGVLPTTHALTVERVGELIRTRLTEHLAESGIEFKEHIGDDMSFDYIGLDSLARVNLMTALDKEFGVKLDPAAAYDFVTVGALSKFVWSQVTGTPLDMKKVLEV
jgi:acyl carrier protein